MSFNKFLGFVLAAVILIIGTVTVTTVVKNGGLPKRSEISSTVNTENPKYINVGKIRSSTKINDKGEKSVLIFTVYFSYDETNTELYEDINLNLYKIKPILTDYFKAFTKEELLKKGEIQIKSEIKSKINKILVLGKIDEIFFEEFQYLD